MFEHRYMHTCKEVLFIEDKRLTEASICSSCHQPYELTAHPIFDEDDLILQDRLANLQKKLIDRNY